MHITGDTRILGIFGDPVVHSLSPMMHNAALRHLELPYVYIPFHVRPADLPAAAAALRAMQIRGVNVTVPHKETVIPYLDRLDESAKSCGAVNTIVNEEGSLVGYNTDGSGFIDSLLEEGFDPRGKNTVIIGAGGSARAVAAALLRQGCGSVVLINRTMDRALALAAALQAADKITVLPFAAGPYPQLADADLVVNTLSVPFLDRGKWLLDLSTVKKALFYDLRYGGMPSDFLTLAGRLRQKGADGLGMLLHQGARAFTLFTGKEAPVEIFRTILSNSAGKTK